MLIFSNGENVLVNGIWIKNLTKDSKNSKFSFSGRLTKMANRINMVYAARIIKLIGFKLLN